MAGEHVAVFVGGVLRPLFDGASVDFYCGSTVGAHQVVMVRRGVALAVQRLAAQAIENVDFSGVGKCLKGPIHSGEPDALTFIDDATVNVAGRSEPRKVSKGIFDGCPLASRSDADCLTAWCRSHVILLLSPFARGRELVVVWLAMWSVST